MVGRVNCMLLDGTLNHQRYALRWRHNGSIASQITSLTIVYSVVYSGAHQRKHQSSASLAFVRGIHRSPVNSPHKWPVTRKMFPFDDVIMARLVLHYRVALTLFFVILPVAEPTRDRGLTFVSVVETGYIEIVSQQLNITWIIRISRNNA